MSFDFLDEEVYMAAALQILHGHSCNIVALPFSTTCNYEHPPLVKVLEAVSFYAFGWAAPAAAGVQSGYVLPVSNPLASLASFLSFRFFQLLMGALSPVLMYSIARSVSKNERLSILAAGLLLLDPLFAFFSRSAYLDVPMIFFALCGYAAYFGAHRMGPLNEYLLSGIFLALSVLSKETGVIFVVPLVCYHLAFGGGVWASKLKAIVSTLLADALVAAVGLQIYDVVERTPFPTFLSQIEYMVSFSNAIACGTKCYANFSYPPWYFLLTRNYWMSGLSNNQVLLWLVLLWIPSGGYVLIRTRGREVGPEERLFVFSLLWFATAFVANELIYLGGRIVWIWYFLPVIPSLALGGAYLVTRPQIPSKFKLVVLGLVAAGYIWAYLVSPNMLLYD